MGLFLTVDIMLIVLSKKQVAIYKRLAFNVASP